MVLGGAERTCGVGNALGAVVVCLASAVAATGGAVGGADAVGCCAGTAGVGLGWTGGAGGRGAGVWGAAVVVGAVVDGAVPAAGLETGGRNGPPLFSGGRNGAGRNEAPATGLDRRGIVGTVEEEGFGKSRVTVRGRSRVGNSNSGKGLESDVDSPPRRVLILSIVRGSTELE